MKRDIGQEILDGIEEIKTGGGVRHAEELSDDAKAIREKTGLSQSAFAGVLGVSVRTLQEWERGRRKPQGPARALLAIASRCPEVLLHGGQR
ncbi:MAG: helix-turn-helix domain-containing protein [Sulfuricurvum sp.]|nr:helix-turn-helix domain-containing protein [Sulfuricurvum sp.]